MRPQAEPLQQGSAQEPSLPVSVICPLLSASTAGAGRAARIPALSHGSHRGHGAGSPGRGCRVGSPDLPGPSDQRPTLAAPVRQGWELSTQLAPCPSPPRASSQAHQLGARLQPPTQRFPLHSPSGTPQQTQTGQIGRGLYPCWDHPPPGTRILCPSCFLHSPTDVGSYLRASGGAECPGCGQRPPAHVPAVPHAVRAPLPIGLFP